jgi:hypothetical protein
MPFHPVALKVPLTDVAALAAATARVLATPWRRDRPPILAYRLRLRAIRVGVQLEWANASAAPEKLDQRRG